VGHEAEKAHPVTDTQSLDLALEPRPLGTVSDEEHLYTGGSKGGGRLDERAYPLLRSKPADEHYAWPADARERILERSGEERGPHARWDDVHAVFFDALRE